MRSNLVTPYLSDDDRGKKTHHRHNRHHIIPRSRGGNNDPNNITHIYIGVHDALHRLFGNMLPHEQIERIIEISGETLTAGFREDLARLLSESDREYYYERGVRKTRRQ